MTEAIIELGDDDMADDLSTDISKQRRVSFHNHNRRLDDVAERFQTTTAFTEAKSNQQWQTGMAMLFPITQNIIEKQDLAGEALRKKVAENSNPPTKGS